MKGYVKLFESWISEAKTEASNDEISDLLNLLIPIIKKSVDDTMRIEMDYAKRLAEVENDAQRSRLFTELGQKKQQAEEPMELFVSSRGKVSQSQFQKILSWAKGLKGLLVNKEMASKEEDFKKLGTDISRWKEMYDPGKITNDIVIRNKEFEREMGINPPLIS